MTSNKQASNNAMAARETELGGYFFVNMITNEQTVPVFKWRKACVDKKEAFPPSFLETMWRRHDKALSFFSFCLLCNVRIHDDVKIYADIMVRLLEVVVVYIVAICTSVSLKLFSRNACEVPASDSASCRNVSLTSEEEMSEDILNERHVETQTCYRSYRKVTAALKRRHQREMLRLKRQTRLMKRQLTSQWEKANKTLVSKKSKLKELQEQLAPLISENQLHVLEKTITQRHIAIERQRHSDLSARIDRVHQQFASIGMMEKFEKSEKHEYKSDKSNCEGGDNISSTKQGFNVANEKYDHDIVLEVESSDTATRLYHAICDLLSGRTCEDTDQNKTRDMGFRSIIVKEGGSTASSRSLGGGAVNVTAGLNMSIINDLFSMVQEAGGSMTLVAVPSGNAEMERGDYDETTQITEKLFTPHVK